MIGSDLHNITCCEVIARRVSEGLDTLTQRIKALFRIHRRSFALTRTMGVDYYKALGVTKSATDDEIKKAYKKMVSRRSTVALT